MTKRQQTLLGVFAHPDDESFGPGGSLARYAAEGKQVHVIIATDGIAGSVEDPKHLVSHETLAQVRSAELSNAAVALGVTTIWSLPYRDSGMRNTAENLHPQALFQQPHEVLTQELVEYIKRLQPDVIVTHDPYGGYGHPDHIRLCETVTAAFHLVRGEMQRRPSGYHGPQKLYYTAFDKRMLKVMVKVMPLMGQDPTAIGRNKDINLVEISGWETPVHAQINIEPYLPNKTAASQAHASQYSGGPAFTRFLPPFLRRRFLIHETFTRAYPAPNGSVETDLFDGIGG
ncbi:MAG: PIG-L family deacetylase [Caldilineaceae bacterium]|nr:PIG-L family deacetylase [Caldilineaceae bacterium]